MPFTPRLTAPIPSNLPRTYFIGHHASALHQLKRTLRHVDLVLEVRDYRLPSSSRNPILIDALTADGRPRRRIVVFTKRDAALSNLSSPRQQTQMDGLLRRVVAAERAPGPALAGKSSVDGNKDADVFFLHRLPPGSSTAPTRKWHAENSPKALLRVIARHAAQRYSLTGLHVLVVGIPNVGKSTLLNALRAAQGQGKAKVARTGADAGVTRSISNRVKILDGADVDGMVSRDDAPPQASGAGVSNEAVYVYDTPGVFPPYVPNGETMMKLAAVGCIKEGIVPATSLADYLLWRMNRGGCGYLRLLKPLALSSPREKPGSEMDTDGRAKTSAVLTEEEARTAAAYVESVHTPGPTNNLAHLLSWIAKAAGKLMKGGAVNYEAAAQLLLTRWRRGELGAGMLDDVEAWGSRWEEEEEEEDEGVEVSVSQARRAERERRRRRARGEVG